MISRCLGNDVDPKLFDTILGRWFPQGDLAQSRQIVKTILRKMIEPSSNDGTGSTILGEINFLYDDPEGYCNVPGTVAYTLNPEKANRDNPEVLLTMHFCQSSKINAYKFPSLGTISRNSIQEHISVDMQTLGGYALIHELT